MDSSMQEQLAAFRYSLIAPIVSRQTPLAPGELKAYLAQAAAQVYHIPGSTRTSVSVRTLERWLSQYRKGEWDGLKPKGRTRKTNLRIPPAVLQEAVRLRKERPERSVEQLIFLLEESGIAEAGTLAVSTLSRHLRKAGANRKEVLATAADKGFRRFEAEDAHLSWQFDYQHNLYLPDPKDPKKRKKAILFAILDDYSRYIVHAEFYWDEKLPRMEDSLKKAILKHGIPEQFYCDNGAAFSSQHLVRICGKLGIRLSHSTVKRPQERGKINTTQQVGAAIGTAILAALSTERANSLLARGLNEASALNGGFHLAYVVSAAFLGVSILAAVTIRRRTRNETLCSSE
jgi:transposase InsO family protein